MLSVVGVLLQKRLIGQRIRQPHQRRLKAARIVELSTNPEAIEQIAREKYLMKKPNEDIYVFDEEE